MAKVAEFIASYLPHHLRREMKELYASTVILNFAVSMIQIFEPVYLYTLGFPLQKIILFFLIVYAAYFLLMPLGARFAKWFGYEHSIVLSTIIFILYYALFYAIAWYPWLLYVAPLLYALQKTFYWPAFHADFVSFADAHEESREIGGMTVIVLLIAVIAPIVSGIIIALWGFGALFAVVALVFICSNVPLLSTLEQFEPKPFKYVDTYKRIFAAENRRSLFAYLGYGEELIVLVVWPIFMVIVIKNLLGLGLVAGLSTLITVVVTMFIGRTSDHRNKRFILRFGDGIYAIVWLLRLFVTTVGGVLLIDTLSTVSKNIVSVPLMALTYERARQKSIMQTVVFFEMSLVVGKLIALVLVYAILFFVPSMYVYQTAFVLAAGMSLLYTLL